MWPFKSVDSLKKSGIFEGFIDWHSHILPGVDDGIATMEDSLKVLKAYENLGFKQVWLTPHIMEDYPNHPEELRCKFEELKKKWDGKVELKLAAENMLDNLFEERIEAGEILPIGDSEDHLLVETSYYNPPMDMERMLERIKRLGYFPMLAHPERYRYMEKQDYIDLKEKGISFQMNIVSLVGGYGELAQKKAEWLLDKEMIDFVGTDIHRFNGFESLIEKSPRKNNYLEALKKIVRQNN